MELGGCKWFGNLPGLLVEGSLEGMEGKWDYLKIEELETSKKLWVGFVAKLSPS